MIKIRIINGANLNMLGKRSSIYGTFTLKEMEQEIAAYATGLGAEIVFFQSNYEGAIIDEIHATTSAYDGLVINAGAYSHYSYAIADALEILDIPKIEVHLTDIKNREDFRKISVTAAFVDETILGKGIDGYKQAVKKICERATLKKQTAKNL